MEESQKPLQRNIPHLWILTLKQQSWNIQNSLYRSINDWSWKIRETMRQCHCNQWKKQLWVNERVITLVVIGSNTRILARVAINERAKDTIWVFSVNDDDVHGCKILKTERQIIAHTARRLKYAGNIFDCKLPNWCRGRFLSTMN